MQTYERCGRDVSALWCGEESTAEVAGEAEALCLMPHAQQAQEGWKLAWSGKAMQHGSRHRAAASQDRTDRVCGHWSIPKKAQRGNTCSNHACTGTGDTGEVMDISTYPSSKQAEDINLQELQKRHMTMLGGHVVGGEKSKHASRHK